MLMIKKLLAILQHSETRSSPRARDIRISNYREPRQDHRAGAEETDRDRLEADDDRRFQFRQPARAARRRPGGHQRRSRQADDDTTYAIPYNADGRFYGHNDGDTEFMGFRIYVDVLTTVGAYPGTVRDSAYFSEAGPPDSEGFFDQGRIFANPAP